MRHALRAVAVAFVTVLPLGIGVPAQAEPVRVTASTRGDTGRLTLTWPKPVTFEAHSADGRFALHFDRPIEADLAQAAVKLRRFVDRPGHGGDGRILSFPLRDGVVALTLADGKRVVVDLFAPAGEAEATDPPAERSTEPADAPAALAMLRPVPAPNRGARSAPTPLAPAVDPIAKKPEGGLANAPAEAAGTGIEKPIDNLNAADGATVATLRFDWTEPVAAAIFRRAGALWIVFDRPSYQDLAALQEAAGPALHALEQRPHERATVLRAELDQAVKPSVSRDALAWIVTLAPDQPPPSPAVAPLLREDADDRHSLALPVAEPGAPLPLTDPVLGDTLVVVPTVPLGAGVRRAHTYPQFQVLPSSQGFVVRPLVDDLHVRAGREGVEVSAAGGLAVTEVDDAVAARARVRSLAVQEPLIGLGDGASMPLAAFTPRRQGLEAAIAASEHAENRESLRLRLARHYLAHGFAAEALAVVQTAERDRPAIAGEPPFLALRAAALVLLGRDAEAWRDLSRPGLADPVEAAAWRTALLVGQGRASADEPTLAAQVAVVAVYPPVLRRVLMPRLAEAAVDAGDPTLASKLVSLVAAEAATAGDKAQAAFLEGRRLAANGDTAGALERWRAVEANPDSDRRSRIRATDARVELALAETKMAAGDAIEALDALAFAWRGDGLEFSVLRRLGDLYLERKDYTAALRTLRRAATNFPDAAREADIPAKMTRAFVALFAGDHDTALRPLEAIALYDEFRELTPAGARGDAVIAAVAERMIGLDLLGRAAALLDSQIRFRLAGAERAATGARLAAVRLLDDKPAAALKALHLSADDALPDPLKRERQMMEARALARLGRTKEALARLDGAATAEAAAIRADIYWDMKDWRRAAGSIARVLKTPAADHRPGSRPDADTVRGDEAAVRTPHSAADLDAERTLHLAVALALAGEEAELVRLGASRGGAMAQSRWRDVFPLITGKTITGADLQSLARELAPVDRFRAYLARGGAAR